MINEVLIWHKGIYLFVVCTIRLKYKNFHFMQIMHIYITKLLTDYYINRKMQIWGSENGALRKCLCFNW